MKLLKYKLIHYLYIFYTCVRLEHLSRLRYTLIPAYIFLSCDLFIQLKIIVGKL